MKTYLFDFDGTLVDSMPSFVNTMLRILDENQISYEPNIIKTITPLGLVGVSDYYVKMGVPFTQQEVIEQIKQYLLDDYLFRIPAKDHVIETLTALKAGGAGLNVLTASPHITLDACLQRLGMTDLFDHIWSCDDFHTTKSDPAIYTAAAQRLGVPVGDVLFLDDNLDANRTAKSAGMKVCGVYDATSAEYAKEIQSAADFYITDFAQLLQIAW